MSTNYLSYQSQEEMEHLPQSIRRVTALAEAPDRIESIAVCVLAHHSLSSSESNLTGLEQRDVDLLSAGAFPKMQTDKMNIFVSCSDGTMHIYDTTLAVDFHGSKEHDSEIAKFFKLRTSMKRFHPKRSPASIIMVVQPWGALVTVSGGDLAGHSLYSEPQLEPISGFPQLPGIHCLAVSSTGDFLCVVVKGRICIFRWVCETNRSPGSNLSFQEKPSSITFQPLHEIKTADTPKIIQFCGETTLIAGFASEYIFFNALTGEDIKRPRVRISSRKSPLLCTYEGNSADQAVVVRDSQGYFLGSDGLPVRSKGGVGERIAWTDHPNILKASSPYLFSLLPRKIQVHLLSNCALCQNVHLADSSYVCTNTDRLVFPPELGENFSNSVSRRALVFVASRKSIHMFSLATIPELVDEIVGSSNELVASRLELGLQVLQSCNKNRMHIGSGVPSSGLGVLESRLYFLLARIQFASGMAQRCFKTARQHLESATAAGRFPIDLVLLLFSKSSLYENVEEVKDITRKLEVLRMELDERVQYLDIGLEAMPIVLCELVPQALNDLDANNLCELRNPELSLALVHVFLPLMREYREHAVHLRQAFEVHPQGNHVIELMDEMLGIVDHLLLKGFLHFDLSRMEATPEIRTWQVRVAEWEVSFLRGETWCKIEEVEKWMLLEPGMWEELLWLYFGKGLHEKAMDWISTLYARAPANDPKRQAYCQSAIDYLRNLGKHYASVILKHSVWIIPNIAASEALSLFVDLPSGVEPLGESVIVEHLERIDEGAKTSFKKTESGLAPEFLSIKYLEYVIHVGGTKDASIQNRLILLYVEYVMFLQRLGMDDASQHARGELLGLLNSLTAYSPEILAPKLQSTELYAEYTILLSKLERHKESLSICINKSKSYEAAEQYCERFFDVRHPIKRDLFLMLLELLVEQGRTEQFFELLEKHFDKLDAVKTLNILPADLSIQELQYFLESLMRHRISEHREAQVVKQLVRKEHVYTMQTKSNLERKYSIIGRHTVCANPLCKKTFQGDSAIARLPNGSIVHYACLKNMTM